MTDNHRRAGRLAMVALCAGAVAGCVHMQPAQTWAELVPRLTPGTAVAVTDTNGTEVRGKVSAVSATSLTLKVAKASREFDSTRVRYVRRDGDSLWNGLAIGAAIGILGAVLPDNRCGGQPPTCDDQQIPQRVTFFGVATAGGIGIDAWRRDRRSLYGSPGPVTLTVMPTLDRGRRGLSITVGFLHALR